ncbi:hypothetical protein AAG906_032910 [Vitis piasezkii]
MSPSPTTTRAASIVSPGTVPYARIHSKVPLAKAVQAGSVDTIGLGNQSTGEIPLDIFNCKKTTSLDLSANMLMGSIPKSISQLKLTDNLIDEQSSYMVSCNHSCLDDKSNIVEVVHDPNRSVHTTSVWEDLLAGITPKQLVIASPRTPPLEILVAKDSDEKCNENFSKTFMKVAPISLNMRN